VKWMISTNLETTSKYGHQRRSAHRTHGIRLRHLLRSGSSQLTADGRSLLIALAQELSKLPNKLSIEGHTDSKPYAASGNYSNWELSSDRANAARQLMQANGIAANQIIQVRGFADQRLRKIDSPLESSNRRSSLIVQYIIKNSDDPDTKPSAAVEEKKPGETI
jgi:chemotaxis protein MotB